MISGGNIRPQTVTSLLQCFSIFNEEKYLIFPVGGYPAHNRNKSVQMAREQGATHLMFIDQDMTFPPDGIQKLFYSNKDIILANYNQRGMPLASTLKVVDESGKMVSRQVESLPKDPFKVWAGGTGFMMVKMPVFDKIPFPWFVSHEKEPDETGDFVTEDIYFCEQAHKYGLDVWCDPTIDVGHIGEFIY